MMIWSAWAVCLERCVLRIVRLSLVLVLLCLVPVTESFGNSFRAEIPVSDGGTLPVYCFVPSHGVQWRLPAVIVAAGVGATKILQYHEHCQYLADRNFFVVFMDPSNYPESLTPGPFSWDRGTGYMLGSINQGVVAGRLAVTNEWYLRTIRSTVDFLCCSPMVDPTRIALSGHSQPANAALTYASADPRIKAVIWNYGGWPWIMPYEPLRLPPVLIFHGDKDDVYDVKYARQLSSELETNCRPHETYIYPCQKHMFNIYYDLRRENRFMKPALLDAFERMVSFLYRALQIPAPVASKSVSGPRRAAADRHPKATQFQ
jgi:dienelactone hydrolase